MMADKPKRTIVSVGSKGDHWGETCGKEVKSDLAVMI